MMYVLLLILVAIIADSSIGLDGKLFGKLWCKIGQHKRYVTVSDGLYFDGKKALDYCRVCEIDPKIVRTEELERARNNRLYPDISSNKVLSVDFAAKKRKT